MDEPVNKVAQSGIITIDPADFIPAEEIVSLDLKGFLYMGLILKEREFRENLKNLDTSVFSGKIAAVHCSADAIIPVWAYMLVVANLSPVCKRVLMGDKESVTRQVIIENILSVDPAVYAEKRVVIKGCGETPIPEEAYFHLTARLLPVAKSIMYGEPCSTVPVYKKKD